MVMSVWIVTSVLVAALGTAAPAAAQATDECAVAPEVHAEYLALGYRAFDQRPGEGWRSLILGPDEGFPCATVVGELIDEYAQVNAEELTPFNLQILRWHAGQLYGFAELTELARERFIASINPVEAEGAPPWNAYVRASVAFLDGDLEELQRQRAIIAATESQMNLAVVDRLIDGFGKSYAEAYTGR